MTSGSAERLKLSDGRLVAEAVPNLVFLSATDRSIQYANRACIEYSGISPDALAESDWLTLVHAADTAAALDSWMHCLSDEMPGDLRLRLLRADGAYRWHLLRLAPLRQPDESVTGWVASATDIDDYQRAADVRQFFATSVQTLTSSLNYNQTLRRLAQLAVPDWADICTVDVMGEGNIIQRLEVACTDPTKAEIVRQVRVRDWLSAPGCDETIAHVLMRGGEVFVPIVTREWLQQVAPPQAVEEIMQLGAVSAICVPLRARNRTLGALALVMAESGRRYTPQELAMARGLASRAGVIVDNARLFAASRKVADELRQANRAKDEFLGMMSHELRTPITTIYGNAQVLQRLMSSLDREAVASALDDIKQDSERLHLIIENLLALARDADRRAYDVEPVLIARVLERMKDLHHRSHPSRHIDLHIEDGQTCVAANPTYLELVVRNLLNNAEKYSPKRLPIEISLECAEQEATVRVLDRGHGIPREEIESVFQPFFRSEPLRDLVPGVGIGLTVCKRLMEAQNGRIWAQARDGGGTELCFALPIEQ
ncbi:MAG: PAS domain-containing protein [Dehalococcoidia bacterium]|nr:PAS domain-containing protein [Dehalococcoidia bacterium]